MNDTNKIIADQPEYIEDSNAPWDTLIDQDIHVKLFFDKYPVTDGHMLFVPKYNSVCVLTECFEHAVQTGIHKVQNKEWDGFNVGFNYGTAAGQTVDWPHVHLIPRRHGDVEDPIGGVRNIIPGKGNYKKS